MDPSDRFVRICKQGALSATEIWMEKMTGVNYLYHQDGYSGGLTPLLEPEGKPIVAPMN